MGWAGGGMFGGGGGGFAGGPRAAANPGGGLPFAGIPSELQDGVEKLLADEPDHGEPKARFAYRAPASESRRLSLRSPLLQHWQLGALAVALVCVVSVANQVGPRLIDFAITNGMGAHKDMGVI